MLRTAARRLTGIAASTTRFGGGEGGRWRPTTGIRLFGSEPHNDDWEANFEDLMAMEDSYGSGVEDLSSAAMELANARMAEQKKLQEEMRRLRGIQVGDRVRVRVRQGAPYPEPIKRYHYTSPFGGAGLGHQPSGGGGVGGGIGMGLGSEGPVESASGIGADDDDLEGFAFASETSANGGGAGGGAGGGGGGGGGGSATTGQQQQQKQRRWKIVQVTGYVVKVRGNRVGVKRNEHLEDTDKVFPTYPKDWVEVLDVGEMWEMKTGPRNLGAFASDEDYAQAQQAWAEATAKMGGGGTGTTTTTTTTTTGGEGAAGAGAGAGVGG